MPKTFALVVISLVGPWLSASALSAEGLEWPQFRGPGARGVAAGKDLPESDLPETWSREENVVWSVPVPGRGWASPIVSGERIYLTTAVSDGAEPGAKKGLYFGGERKEPSSHRHRWMALAYDFRTGGLVWARTLQEGLPTTPRHIKSNYAPETPTTDGERVYAYFGDVGLFALSLDGDILWKRSWGSFPTRYGWGNAASPIVHGDRVYILNDNDRASFLEALDKRTGETVWRVERDEKSNWSTPFVWENATRTEIVTPGTGLTRSYDLDGKLLWSVGGFSSITIATPYAVDGLLYVSSGYVGDSKRPIYAIRPGASGELTPGAEDERFVAWSLAREAPYNPTTLVYEGLLYVLYDFGFFACFDAKTGEEVYGKQRIRRDRTPFTASPWAYDGKVFCLSEDGDCFVFRAGREYELLRTNSLEEMCMATPAIAHGSLIIRTAEGLWRIAREPEPAEPAEPAEDADER